MVGHILRYIPSLICIPAAVSAVAVSTHFNHFGKRDGGIPSADYKPQFQAIPFPFYNSSAEPWNSLDTVSTTDIPALGKRACPGVTPGGSTKYWYEAITHNGESSFLDSSIKANYKVFRNVVTDYGADNTGNSDASAAIQRAISAGASNGADRSGFKMGSTGQPAMVYLPAGTYRMDASIQTFLGTVIIGDALNPPILKASANFPHDHLIYAKDPNLDGTVNFYIGIKNLILDSTNIDPATSFTLVDWSVSQATQITNINFRMPNYSTGHIGLSTQYGFKSNIIMNDLTFNGGAVGIAMDGQQWLYKGMTFIGTKVGIKGSCFACVFLHCSFQYGDTGIDASGISSSMALIDSTGDSLGALIRTSASSDASHAIIIENVQNTNGPTVVVDGNIVLSGNVPNTWVRGTAYTSGSTTSKLVNGATYTTERTAPLLVNGKYFTAAPPTYKDYSVDQFVNIKTVFGLPVLGNGATDDTVNINKILAQYAGCKIIYFPAGTYIVTGTVFVPAGSIIVGDAYASVISASGATFKDPANPVPLIKVGNTGDVGTAQISDMLFTVADILPGCKLLEVNMAGSTPGAVALWNTHIRVGGAVGSKVLTACKSTPDQCRAAWTMVHLTASSSAYIENMWAWTADHDLEKPLDQDIGQTIATGRGMLIESTKATWLVGTGSEHNTLYQYNFNNAQNVASFIQQSESPYWQGPGSIGTPKPWDQYLVDGSDPIWSQCGTDDLQCRMAWFERISHSSNLFLYGGMNWVFFNNGGNCNGGSGPCQQNAINILSSSKVYLYGTNTKDITNLVLQDSNVVATEQANKGGWGNFGGVIAAYLYNT